MPRQLPREEIVNELEKQYEIVQVDPNSTLEKFDVLMVVQPSSLTPPQLENLIDSIRAGQPKFGCILDQHHPLIARNLTKHSVEESRFTRRCTAGNQNGAALFNRAAQKSYWLLLRVYSRFSRG